MLTIEKCFAVEGLLNEAKLEENYQKVLLEFIAGLKREVSIELEGRRRHWALRRQFPRKCKWICCIWIWNRIMSDLEAQSDDEAVEDSSSSNDGTYEGDDVEEAVV